MDDSSMTTPIEIHDRKPLTRNQRVKLFVDHEGTCCICWGNISVAEPWIDEHIIPLAMGGTNDWSNRAPAHLKCAKVKTKKDMGNIAKAKRIEAKHIGAVKTKKKIPSRGFAAQKSNTKQTKVRF